jgi:hypothetical protein
VKLRASAFISQLRSQLGQPSLLMIALTADALDAVVVRPSPAARETPIVHLEMHSFPTLLSGMSYERRLRFRTTRSA